MMLAVSTAISAVRIATVTMTEPREEWNVCGVVFMRSMPRRNGVIETAAREEIVGVGAVHEFDVDRDEAVRGRLRGGLRGKHRVAVAGHKGRGRRRSHATDAARVDQLAVGEQRIRAEVDGI